MASVLRHKNQYDNALSTPVIRRPSESELRAQARDAMREKGGVDFGPMTHEERNRILFGL